VDEQNDMLPQDHRTLINRIDHLEVPMMPEALAFSYGGSDYTDGTIVMLTDLQNLIMAYKRMLTIETQRLPRKRATDFVITMRAVPDVEIPGAMAIFDHAKVRTPGEDLVA